MKCLASHVKKYNKMCKKCSVITTPSTQVLPFSNADAWADWVSVKSTRVEK